MADLFTQRFRYGNPEKSGYTDQWTPYEGVGDSLGGSFLRGYEDPTYLTYRLEFGDWGTSLNGPTTKNSLSTMFAAYASDYDELPMGLLDCNDTDVFTDKTQFYNAYNYLRSRNEDKRAKYLKAFRNGLYAITMKAPYIFGKISGIGALQQFNSKGAMRVKDATVTIDCVEGLDLKIKTLMTWYRKAAWDDIYQRWILPENMREFKMIIYIFEQRQFHHVDLEDRDYQQFIPTIYNDDLNSNLPVFALECEPCEFVIDGMYGDQYSLAFPDNQQTTSQIKIKVKNVRTYLKNGLLPYNLATQVIYDLQDMLDRRGDTTFASTTNGDGGTTTTGASVNSVKEKFMSKSVWESPEAEMDNGESWWYDAIISGKLLNADDNLFSKDTWRKIGRGVLDIITSTRQHILGHMGVQKNGSLVANIMDCVEYPDKALVVSPVSEYNMLYDDGYDLGDRYIKHDLMEPDFTDRFSPDDMVEPDMSERYQNHDLVEPDFEKDVIDMSMEEPDFKDRMKPDWVMPENNDERSIVEQVLPTNNDARQIDMSMLEPDDARTVLAGDMPANDDTRRVVSGQMPYNDVEREKVEQVMPYNTIERVVHDGVMPTNMDEREPADMYAVNLDGRVVPEYGLLQPDGSQRVFEHDLLAPDMTERVSDIDMLEPDMNGRPVDMAMLTPDDRQRVVHGDMLPPDMTERSSVQPLLTPDMGERGIEQALLAPDMNARILGSQMNGVDEGRFVPTYNMVEPSFDGRHIDGNMTGADEGRVLPEFSLNHPDATTRQVDTTMSAQDYTDRIMDMDMLKPDMMERGRQPFAMTGMDDGRDVRNDIAHVEMEERSKKFGIDAEPVEARTLADMSAVDMDGERVIKDDISTTMDDERQVGVFAMDKVEFCDILSKATMKTTTEFDRIEQDNKEDEGKARRLLNLQRFERLDETGAAKLTSVQMVKLFTDERGMLKMSFINRLTKLQGDLRKENDRIIRQNGLEGIEQVGRQPEHTVLLTPDLKDRLIENAAMANIDQETLRDMSYQTLISLHESMTTALEKSINEQPIETTGYKSKATQKSNDVKREVMKTKPERVDRNVRPLLGHTEDEPRETPKRIL